MLLARRFKMVGEKNIASSSGCATTSSTRSEGEHQRAPICCCTDRQKKARRATTTTDNRVKADGMVSWVQLFSRQAVRKVIRQSAATRNAQVWRNKLQGIATVSHNHSPNCILSQRGRKANVLQSRPYTITTSFPKILTTAINLRVYFPCYPAH